MARRDIPLTTLLAKQPLFHELDAASLERLAQTTTRLEPRRGELVFAKGDDPTGMYVVVYGEVELISSTPARGPRLWGIVSAGHSFGEPVMFLKRPALVEARAANDCLLLHVPRESLFGEIERSPEFARRMIAGLCRQIESLVREIDGQARGSGSRRLAAYLLRQREGDGESIVVRLPAPKAQIASHLNLTPEHFSRILRDLARSGVLQVEGRTITVPSAMRLQEMCR
jgi:CRP-like cAMP-binding protein